MSRLAFLVVSLLLMLVSLPVLSFGTDQDQQAVWIGGLTLLTAGGVIPPLLRFTKPAKTGDDGGDQDDADEQRDT